MSKLRLNICWLFLLMVRFNFKKIAVTLGILFSCELAFGYSPTPLTPKWFKSVSDGFFENKDDIWRGTVTDVVDGRTLLIKNKINENIVEVELLHLEPIGNNIGINALRNLIGYDVYVLGNNDDNAISARLFGHLGDDLNLSLIQSGSHEANTTSLYFSDYKVKYKRK